MIQILNKGVNSKLRKVEGWDIDFKYLKVDWNKFDQTDDIFSMKVIMKVMITNYNNLKVK